MRDIKSRGNIIEVWFLFRDTQFQENVPKTWRVMVLGTNYVTVESRKSVFIYQSTAVSSHFRAPVGLIQRGNEREVKKFRYPSKGTNEHNSISFQKPIYFRPKNQLMLALSSEFHNDSDTPAKKHFGLSIQAPPPIPNSGIYVYTVHLCSNENTWGFGSGWFQAEAT